MSDTTDRLTAIHGMLSAGHRSLRIERHSLILWGLAGAALLLLSGHILTPDQFPDVGARAMAWLFLLAMVFGGVGALDWHWTRRAKQARDETWSFVHRQIIKVWWLLMAIGTLLTVAMFVFGGGYMVCAAWLVLLGLGLYIHGLFSEELLEWTGVLMILLGIFSLAMRLPFDTMRWITTSTFGIGLPVLAFMLDRGTRRPVWQRLGQSIVWILAVSVLPLGAQSYSLTLASISGPVVALSDYRQVRDELGTRIVSLPAGTLVPVEVEVSGGLFHGASPLVLPLTLSHAVEVAITDGRLTGAARIPGGHWLPPGQTPWINIPAITAELTPDGGPVVRASLIVDMTHTP